jgi:hypothetical protein
VPSRQLHCVLCYSRHQLCTLLQGIGEHRCDHRSQCRCAKCPTQLGVLAWECQGSHLLH